MPGMFEREKQRGGEKKAWMMGWTVGTGLGPRALEWSFLLCFFTPAMRANKRNDEERQVHIGQGASRCRLWEGGRCSLSRVRYEERATGESREPLNATIAFLFSSSRFGGFSINWTTGFSAEQ